jgi:hypothetical protein
MATFDDELLKAARRLLHRRTGQRGKLPRARIRRSISTSYYALFHFLLEEASYRVIGSNNNLRRRRRLFGRVLTHAGIKAALDRVKGRSIDTSVAEFLSPTGILSEPLVTPTFVRDLAIAFADAQAKRHDADYDLTKPLSELDAQVIHGRVKRVIRQWRNATSQADKDFKHALCVLMLLKGRLRSEA